MTTKGCLFRNRRRNHVSPGLCNAIIKLFLCKLRSLISAMSGVWYSFECQKNGLSLYRDHFSARVYMAVFAGAPCEEANSCTALLVSLCIGYLCKNRIQ